MNGSNGSNGAPPAIVAPMADGQRAPAGPSAPDISAGLREGLSRVDWTAPAGAAPRRGGADAADTIDLAAAARAIVRGWRTVAVGVVLGALVALALVLYFPPRYRARATVLVRNANDPTGGLLSRVGLAGEFAGGGSGGGGGLLGGALKSPLETELQLISSRDVLGQAVDSLGLRARVTSPFGVASRALVRVGPSEASFRHRSYGFTRESSDHFRVDGPDTALSARVGQPFVLPNVGLVTIVADPAAPARFDVQFEDREDAITRLDRHLTSEKEGGEVVSLTYAGQDSLTAASVPNAIAAVYLSRRRTVDRGYNQRRFEFLSAQADTVSRQLAASEDALRGQQEGSGVFDPEISGKSTVEALREFRTQEVTADAERRTIRELVDGVERGSLTPRQLSAFPAFLRSPAINSILSQITGLEARRTDLLSVRTERDPDVIVLTSSIRDLEQQLLPLGRTYAASLETQTRELGRARAQVEQQLENLPGQAEGAFRRQRDVKRLSTTLLGLQAQMIEARLAAITEGGQVRQVDVARAPKKRQFPDPVPTLVGGLVLGALLGAIWAAVRAAAANRPMTADEVETSTGVPAVTLEHDRPLLLGAAVDDGAIVVLPLGAADPALAAATRAVVDRLAEQAEARGHRAAVVELTRSDQSTAAAAGELAAAASASGVVLVVTSGLESRRTLLALDPTTRAILVLRAGHTTASAILSTVRALDRFGTAVLGVVIVRDLSARPRSESRRAAVPG